jgi:hypothetical protein
MTTTTDQALARVTAESIRLIVGLPAPESWGDPEASRCASCGHLPGCACPEDCEPGRAA